MISPRTLRRTLLRALPLPVLLGAGALSLGAGWGSAASVATLGVAPALALFPELLVEAKVPARTASNEVMLALGKRLIVVIGLLLLTAQGFYLNAMLSNVDPAAAVSAALSVPKPIVLVAVGFAALPFAATTTLLASVHLEGLERLPGYGLWALAGVWLLLTVPATLVAAPPRGTPVYSYRSS